MIRFALVAVLVACGPGIKGGGPTINSHMTQPDTASQTSAVVSSDILAREPVSNSAQIKHILVGWKGTNPDPRSDKRTKAEAEGVVKGILAQLKGGADFDAMMKQYSEDPGSAATAKAYSVSPDASLVIEFKQLGLRLQLNEVGVVESEYGFHIMKRVE
ncbi:MAG: peptidylprolyl isomerase [Deltaproteobacteria bacterium]|nr:peptidylprolyl isomerase [Deltaproteobacteria bacterium]